MTKAMPSRNSALLLGRNDRGHWIVRDSSGSRGGLFVSHAAAMRYARMETGSRSPAVTLISDNLDLGFSPVY
jgi:hypothetical protein